MSVLFYLGAAALAFVLASRVYSRWIARQMGEDPDGVTPACRINDGRDFVPTPPYVVFAHHFSTIAGAGPIVGPTIAILYGFLPAWLWVVFGGVFIGAVHDFTALFVCMREGGKSMAEVARKTLGPAGFTLFILFTIIMLLLVTSSFLNMVSISLTSLWPLEKLGLAEGQTLLKTTVVDGVNMGRIGGIASMSVVIITLSAPFLGWLIHKKSMPGYVTYPTALVICVASILVGIQFPISLPGNAWLIIISVYVLIAAGVPVWIILQPRDFINAQILYAGIVLLLVSLLVAGLKGLPINIPAANIAEGVQHYGFIWPILFITIACGAISGFHSLVAGGTTTKQISGECDARRVGFNAMLLESLLAVCVLLAIGVGLDFDDYKTIMVTGTDKNPVLAFSLAVGHLLNRTLGLPVDLATVFGVLLVEGFVVTTLDSAVRLNRYLFEELWNMAFKNPPAFLKHYWFNSGLAVVLMWVMASTNAINLLWPIFGTSNQLLAALGLITITVWLMLRKRRYFFVLIPAIFMMVTTFASLLILLESYWSKGKYLLLGTDLFLLALAIGLVALLIRRVRDRGAAAEA